VPTRQPAAISASGLDLGPTDLERRIVQGIGDSRPDLSLNTTGPHLIEKSTQSPAPP
jgi:hypothetical protein